METNQSPQTSKQRSVIFRPMFVLVIAVIVLVIIVAVLVGTRGKTSISHTGKAQSAASLQAGKVEITASGFVPASIQVKVGDTVTWTNNDGALHQIATDPYPAEDGLPGFAAKTPVLKGETYRFTFTKAGNFNYHDHLNPFKYKGTVVVQ